MDPSSYVHPHQHRHNNHPRYVPFSPRPPPTLHQPPPHSAHSYRQSPNNLYPSRHHHHLPPPQPPPQLRPLPPPPPQPPQQQQPYRHVPAPPLPLPREQQPNHHPYNPHHPQYAFNPNPSINSSPNIKNVSHELHDLPQRRMSELDSRPDNWADNRLIRSHHFNILDREDHYHQYDRRPASPGIDRFRHVLEGSSRFRDIQLNQRERGREELGRIFSDRRMSSRPSRDFRIVSMGIESNTNDSGFDREVADNVRWGPRSRDQLIDDGNNEINERDEMRGFQRNIDYYYDPETERLNDRGSSREGSHEFNRTPRKQVPKKSAFLRIQKAKSSHRSREDERSHYSGYSNEGKTGNFRGKDLVLHSDNGKEKERESSPVELDVSFKSNSLVAKAIVTPPSDAPISDSSVTPRNSKIRKVMLFDKDSLSLPIKANESSCKLDGSTSVVNSGSEYSNQSEGKVKSSGTCNLQDSVTKSFLKGSNVSLTKGKVKRTAKVTVNLDDSLCTTKDVPNSDNKPEPLDGKGTIPCTGNTGDGGVQAYSNRANVSVGEKKVEGTCKNTLSDKTSASVGKQPSVKATKKKKVVRKVVKKVTNSPMNLAKLESAKKSDKPAKADTSTHCLSAASGADKIVTPLKMKTAPPTGDLVQGVDSKLFPKESSVLPENEKVYGVSKDSKDVGTDADPGNSVAPKTKRKRNSSIHSSSSSGQEETKVDHLCVNADNSVPSPHMISNSKENVTETPNVTITSDSLVVEDVDKQFFNKESNIDHGLSRSEGANVHGNIVDIDRSSDAKYGSTCFDCGSSSNQKTNIPCDIDNVNSGSNQIGAAPGSPAVEDGTTEAFPEADFSVIGHKMPHLPCSEKTQANSGSVYTGCSNQNVNSVGTPDIGFAISGESNHVIGGDFVKHMLPSALTLENSGTEGITNAVESLEGKGDYTTDIQKQKVGMSELDLSSSTFTDISIASADVLNPANCLDGSITTSCINHNPVEAMVGGIRWHDKVSKLLGSNLIDTEVSANANGKSPEKKNTISTNVTASGISKGISVSDICMSAAQLLSNCTGDLLHLGQEVKESSTDVNKLHVNSLEAGPSQAVGSFRVAYKENHPGIDSCLAFVESVAPSSPYLDPLKLGGRELSTTTEFAAVNQIDAMDIDGDNRGEVHLSTAEEQKVISNEVTQCEIISEHKSSSLGQTLPSTDVEDNNHLPLKDDLPCAPNSLIFEINASEVSASNTNDEVMPAPNAPYDVGSPSNHDNQIISTSNCEAHLYENSEDKAYGDEKLSYDKPTTEGGCVSSALVPYSQQRKTISNSSDAIRINQSVSGKAGMLPIHDSKGTNSPSFIGGETHGGKNQPSHVPLKSYSTRSSFVFSASKNKTSSTNNTKPRTWHRTDISASTTSGKKPFFSANPSHNQMPKRAGNFQSTSYIRKGNSLVRKPVSVPALPQSSSVCRLNSGVVDEVKKGTEPTSRADAVNLRTGGANTTFERPGTPPLSSVNKVAMHTSNSLGECALSTLAEPYVSDCCETTANHSNLMEINDVLNSPEEGFKSSENLDQNSPVNNLEDLTEQNGSDSVLSNAKMVTYLKPKSNQLIATSDGTTSINADKNQSFPASFDGYYKKRKNQLIRTALESNIKQAVISDEKSNSVGEVDGKIFPGRTFGRRRSNKVVAKTLKPSKFSLVWTLHGGKLSTNDGNDLCHSKVLPQLFPWKRMTYKRSFRLNSVSSYSSSLSIGRKMLLLRKRNTVYTRSINGFSIRKSKVLSVGGSSLKWSKSLERHSRKANEEATLAVAEAERKKREQNGILLGTGKRSHSCKKVVHGTELCPGERIFRVGSVRYKMDSSRRSLQRISDDGSSYSAGHQSENSAKKSYVPRRLVIGNDEYVRIGNGNQLVRDPKKRTRVLASEKVRWSLHTARLRLVKKGKYCQFFTRFGKCNKDDGKCPYIHDSSKIAVCTKFLNGLCSNPKCKLTHKVIPERMPDCSYFLQGLCTNENCPYRHVHVNPKASTCEGFLRGYCADGNECRKKHSYVCPDYEATGSCPQGSKCKLHHPKNRSKGKKRKRSMEHKNARGRYFGIDILEPKRMVSERQQALQDDNIFLGGNLYDYISVDASDDEAGEIDQMICDQTTIGDNDSSDTQLDAFDELIKPIHIMN